jgi:transposase-like protein
VAKPGQTLAGLLTEPRDEAAARRLLPKALRRPGVPEKSPLDGRAAHAAASKSDNAEPGPARSMRPGTDRNHRVAQEQRGVQRGPRPLLGGKAFAAAQGPGVGIARRPMLKPRPMLIEAGAEGLTAAEPC